VNEILHTADGRSVLRMERRLAHPARKVWEAITDPVHLDAWFPSSVELPELTLGGKMRFVFDGGEGPTLDGSIVELEPPWVFGFSWGDDLLRIELRPDGDDCVLVFTHTFADTPGAASFAAGWDACLTALATSLQGEPTSPADRGAMDQRHEAFVETFGLAEGAVETTDDDSRWRVRFERQLVRPAETVWAALLGGNAEAAPAVGDPVPPGFTLPGSPAADYRVTEVDPPTTLAFGWRYQGEVVGEVRWLLTTGTGQGARLVLAQTGPAELAEARQVALVAWRTRIEQLAHSLLTT
jgi:uncharacterized protein YndB with AHSA1/START domain